jgi:hypothetical protein
VLVKSQATGHIEWRFTGFYGNPSRTARKRSWELMKYLRREFDNPWLCAGDFNEVLSASEQLGGNDREEWMMEGFRYVVEYCRMTDLGYIGLPYTWDNRQQGYNNIKVRLDRGLGDDKFMELFDNSTVRHIQTTESDHCALLINMCRSEWLGGGPSGRPFRFENMCQKRMANRSAKLGRGSLGLGPSQVRSDSLEQ